MNTVYQQKSPQELAEILENLHKQHEQIKQKGIRLDMSRGKPSPEQLDLTQDLMDVLHKDSCLIAEDGTDCRNYGGLDGIVEAKRLMASMLDVAQDEVFVGNGSSLNLMHDLATFCWLHPMPGNQIPWSKQGEIKFLCPSPGYDRHFAVSEHLGIQNIPVPMTAEGPDMDVVEQMVAADPQIKGMWCVPKYSNPTGITYSDETVRRMAALQPAATDFRIFWDNAYGVHDLYEDQNVALLSLMDELKKNKKEDMAFLFASFSKISFGGAGIAAAAASADNMAWIIRQMSMQMICSDKINQLRHVRYFGDLAGVRAHMQKHAAILRPKFQAVQKILEQGLVALGIATCSKPLGGYFISLDVPAGCAKRTIALCKEAGVVMTPAGATFPGKHDPEDSNIRIAPSYPSVEELCQAAELLCLCTKIAVVEKLIA